MADITRPFQNKFWYYEESSYGTCPTMTDTAKPISCEWRIARISAGDKHTVNYNAESPAPSTLWEQVDDFRLYLEYVPQCDDALLARCINRQSTGELFSNSFILGLNTKQPVADQTWYELCGCKADRIRVSSSTNNKYVITIEFIVKTLYTDGDASFITDNLADLANEEPSALTGAYLGFNVAGGITKGGSDFAYVVNSIDLSIEHNLNPDGYDHDSKTRQYCVEGRWSGTGTVDLSLDEGGGIHWADVMNQNEFDVVINLGGSGCPRITLPNCKWLNPEVSVEVEDSHMMRSAVFNSNPTDGDIESIVDSTP
jgi:hypothetical protein